MNDVTLVMHLIAVWPLVAFALLQSAAIIWWAATVSADMKHLKDHSNISQKNGERLANMEGKLDGIISAIENINQNMPKRRGT